MKRMNFLIGMVGISLALGMMVVGCDTGGGGGGGSGSGGNIIGVYSVGSDGNLSKIAFTSSIWSFGSDSGIYTLNGNTAILMRVNTGTGYSSPSNYSVYTYFGTVTIDGSTITLTLVRDNGGTYPLTKIDS